MRKAFIQTLTNAAKTNKNLILLTGDLGFTVFEEFQAKFPRQFINIGVAEQNMIGIAGGLALTGKTVFCYSIASFATGRVYEQIRLDVAAHHVSVVIVGTGAGLSYSTASITHQALDDMALMNLIPGMTIFAPGDNFETVWAVTQSIQLHQPVYLRLGKNEEPDVHQGKPDLKVGKGYFLNNGKDIAILACGTAVNIALEVSVILKNKNLNPTIVSIHTLKPFDHQLVIKLSKTHQLCITIEEHGIIGGLGTAVSKAITENNLSLKLITIGTPDRFISQIGSLNYLRRCCGLNPINIAQKIIRAI
jgi:transketolase